MVGTALVGEVFRPGGRGRAGGQWCSPRLRSAAAWPSPVLGTAHQFQEQRRNSVKVAQNAWRVGMSDMQESWDHSTQTTL